jgi:hypothetical protein
LPFAEPVVNGGRSLRVIALVRGAAVRGAETCGASLRGEFDDPKPAGARPRSVVLPCADQLRLLPLLAGLFAPRFKLLSDAGLRM